LNDEQRRVALEAARGAIAARLAGHAFMVPSALALPPASGVFVTIKVRDRLRGCLGTLECRQPLIEEIARCGADAATEDPRFSPLTPQELVVLSIEISVLGPLERIDPHSDGAIVIGTHGLVVEHGRRRGVLLPQVAVEREWTVEQFLRQTCVKAEVAADAWQHGAAVYRFDAEIFGAGPAEN
jgi:AmmeMemoRadiSam system protein A